MPRVAIHPSAVIADLLRKRRESMGLSLRKVQTELATSGESIPFATLGRVERGEVDPGVRRLHSLLRMYGVPIQLAADLLDLEAMSDERPVQGSLDAIGRRGIEYFRAGELRKGLAHLFALRSLEARSPAERLTQQKGVLSMAIAAGALGRYELARHIIERLLREPLDSTVVVSVLVQAAVCWRRLGSIDACLAFLLRAEERAAGDRQDQELAWVHHERAQALADLGDHGRAESSLRKALGHYRAAGDAHGESLALGVRTRLLRAAGRWAEALEAARAGKAHAERHGFKRVELGRLLDSGEAARGLGKHGEAAAFFKEALAGAIALGDDAIRFYAHYHLWKTHEALGERGRAALELQEALYYVKFLDEVAPEAVEVRRARDREAVSRRAHGKPAPSARPAPSRSRVRRARG